MHPHKEWWRERRIAPATFMGFPDVTKAELRGYNLYTEQMDAPTLAVIVDKCVEEKILNEEFWARFSWRTQQIINTINETELVYLMRGFSRADWFDSHLVLSMWGRADFLLPRIGLVDASVLLEAFMNPRFRNANYEKKLLNHIESLVIVRNDWITEEFCKLIAVIGRGENLTIESIELRKKILSILIEKISNDFFDITMDMFVGIFESIAVLGIPEQKGLEFVLSLTRELRESPRQRPDSGFGDESISILQSLSRMGIIEIEKQLVSDLLIEYYDNIYRLSHEALLHAISGFQVERSLIEMAHTCLPSDHSTLLMTRIKREIYKMKNRHVCSVLKCVLNSDSGAPMQSECIEECLGRLAEVGIDGVPKDLLLELAERGENSADLEKSFSPNIVQDLKKLVNVVQLVVA